MDKETYKRRLLELIEREDVSDTHLEHRLGIIDRALTMRDVICVAFGDADDGTTDAFIGTATDQESIDQIALLLAYALKR